MATAESLDDGGAATQRVRRGIDVLVEVLRDALHGQLDLARHDVDLRGVRAHNCGRRQMGTGNEGKQAERVLGRSGAATGPEVVLPVAPYPLDRCGRGLMPSTRRCQSGADVVRPAVNQPPEQTPHAIAVPPAVTDTVIICFHTKAAQGNDERCGGAGAGAEGPGL